MVDGITNSVDMSLSKLQEMVKDRKDLCAAVCSPWGLHRVGHNWATEQKQQNTHKQKHTHTCPINIRKFISFILVVLDIFLMPNVCKWFVFDAIEYGVVVVPRGCPSTNAVKVNESVKFSVCVCVCVFNS